MPDIELKSVSLGDRVFQDLLERIHSGRIPPGTEIKEVRLATELGVSRGPVREAVRRLQGLELITREAYMRARVVTLTPRAMLDLFQMREALEGYAARLAAERMPRDAAQALLASLDPDEASPPLDFHQVVVIASENPRLIRALCDDLYHLLKLYRRRSGAAPERKSAAPHEHWQIAHAIAAGDGVLAENLMRAHILRASHRLQAELTPEHMA